MNYYLAKILNLMRKFTMRSIDGAIYTNTKKPLAAYDSVFFYFDDVQLMHLGDQLYFKPLITKLKNSGYKVLVDPTASMCFFFQDCLVDYTATDFDPQKVLIISRIELLPKIRSKFGAVDYFLCDSMAHQINIPICNYILNSFINYYDLKLDLSISACDFLDFSLIPYVKYGLADKNKIIFLNNYADSGKFRISSARKKLLLTRLLQERANSYVVHLGTKADKLNDPGDYSNIVDLDLRGMTTPEEIFSLMNLGNIAAVYCHDTYVLHVANFFDLNINLVFKRFFLYNKQKQIAFTSLFAKKDRNYVVIL